MKLVIKSSQVSGNNCSFTVEDRDNLIRIGQMYNLDTGELLPYNIYPEHSFIITPYTENGGIVTAKTIQEISQELTTLMIGKMAAVDAQTSIMGAFPAETIFYQSV